MIANCSFSHENEGPCLRAKPLLTDAGLCFALNSYDMATYFQPTEFMSTFEEQVKDKVYEDEDPQNIHGAGEKFSFKIVLDAQVTEQKCVL